MTRRRLRLPVLLAVCVAVVLGLRAPVAFAHNSLETSDPADGTRVVAAAALTLDFAKDVPLGTLTVTLIQPDGSRADLPGSTNGPTADIVVTPLPALAAGAYTARWRLVGADGHAVTGRIAFTVSGSPEPSPATTLQVTTLPVTTLPAAATGGAGDGDGFDPPAWIGWLFRYGSYAALMVLAGAALTGALVQRGEPASPRARRWAPWAVVAVVVGALGQLALLAGSISGVAPWSQPSGLTDAAEHPVGLALVFRVALAVAVWLLVVREAQPRSPHHLEVTALLALGMLATWSFAGHPRTMRWPWLGVPLDVAHHAAAAAWLGGLLMVGGQAAALRRFSRVAELSVGVLVVTGVLQAIRLDGGPAALISGTHGRLLLVKVALLVPMLWLANANRRRLRAAVGDDTAPDVEAVQRSMRIELLIGLAILGVTASLVVTPPSSDLAAAQPVTSRVCAAGTVANGTAVGGASAHCA